MLALTSETGQEVRTGDGRVGRVLGRLRDLTVRLDAEHPTVHRLAVGSPRWLTHLVAWEDVISFGRSGVVVDEPASRPEFAVDATHLPLRSDELLLVRDVLDTQIVDVVGHRLARVSDVLLSWTAEGRLEVVAVDVGMKGVCRRLGLRRLSEHLRERAVDWSDLHLGGGRGHEIHLATTVAAVHRLGPHDLAELLTRLNPDRAAEVLAAVGPRRAADAVTRTHPEVGGRLMLALDSDEAAKVMDEMAPATGRHYRHLLGTRSPLTRRRFSRLRGWRRHDLPRPGTGAER